MSFLLGDGGDLPDEGDLPDGGDSGLPDGGDGGLPDADGPDGSDMPFDDPDIPSESTDEPADNSTDTSDTLTHDLTPLWLPVFEVSLSPDSIGSLARTSNMMFCDGFTAASEFVEAVSAEPEMQTTWPFLMHNTAEGTFFLTYIKPTT